MSYIRRRPTTRQIKSTGVFRQRWFPRIRKTRNVIFILSRPPIPVESDYIVNYEHTLPCINEIQDIYFNGQSSPINKNLLEAGDFTITFDGQTTDPISYNYTTTESAIQALSNVGTGNTISTINGGGTSERVEFILSLSGQNFPLMTATPNGLKAKADTITITTTQNGQDPVSTSPSNGVNTAASSPVDEEQILDLNGATTGSFDINGNFTSATISTFDTTSVQAACDSVWGSGNTFVDFIGGVYHIFFMNSFAGTNVSEMTVSNNTTDGSPFFSTSVNGAAGVNQVDWCTFNSGNPINGDMLFDGNTLNYSTDASTLSLSGATASGTPSSGLITTTWSDYSSHTPFSVSSVDLVSDNGQPQIVSVVLSDSPTEGSLTITLDALNSGEISYNEATPSISGWTTSGSAGNWIFTRNTNASNVSASASENNPLRITISTIEIVGVQDGQCVSTEIEVTADHVVNLEYLLNLSIDKIVNYEYLLSLQSNNVINFENLTGISTDYSVNLEGLLLIEKNQIVNLEYLLSLVNDNVENVEFLITVNADGSINVEWLAEIGNADNTILIENLATIHSDGNVNVEYKASISGDNVINLEYLLNTIVDNQSNIEYIVNISSNGLVNIEWRGSISNDFEFINIEYLTNILKDNSSNVEYSLILNNDTKINYENLKMISSDQAANIEYLLNLFSDYNVDIEYLLTISSDGTVNIEWTGVTGITSDANIPFEFLTTISADGEINVERLTNIARENTVNSESLSSISEDKLLHTENLLGLYSDSSISLEFLINVGNIDSSTLVEYLSTLNIDNELKVEYLQDVSSALVNNVEYLTELSADQLVNLETLQDFSSANFTIPFELLSLIQQDQLLNYEWRQQTVDLYPLIKWTLQNRKRVYIYSGDTEKSWNFNNRSNRYWNSENINKTWSFSTDIRYRTWMLSE